MSNKKRKYSNIGTLTFYQFIMVAFLIVLGTLVALAPFILVIYLHFSKLANEEAINEEYAIQTEVAPIVRTL